MSDISISISVTRKVNLGNYESADAFLSLSGIPVDATEADILDALNAADLAFEPIKAKAVEMANRLRTEGRGGGGRGPANMGVGS